MSDRLKLPPERDFGFYQRRKHDKWRQVAPPDPPLEAPVADSHAHAHMLPDPAWEMRRCAANGVNFVCNIIDPSEDDARMLDALGEWTGPSCGTSVKAAVGVHPHNAQRYGDALEARLLACLRSPHVVAVGEIGLDYYYDISPRDAQREVFRRQIQIARQLDLPIALHLRDGQDPRNPADDAHAEAFGILRELDALGPGTLVHCCTMSPDQIRPWIEADCYIAYGGALTFKNSDAAREGARLVPANRLLFETDAPYMTPEPMRGAACTPAHVIFTAASLAETLGHTPGSARKEFLQQVHANTLAFYRVADQLGADEHRDEYWGQAP